MPMPKDPIKAEEARKRMRESQIKRFDDPKERERQGEITRRMWTIPSFREKATRGIQQSVGTIEHRRKQSEIITKALSTDRAKENLSIAAKKLWDDPNYRRLQSESQQKAWRDPKVRDLRRKSLSASWLKRTNLILNHIVSYYGNEFLYDHAQIDFPKYCETFLEIRPRVRSFFNHTCIKCGSVENNRKLNVHHVFYEKKTCCWIDENGEYWTNLNAKDHPEKDYYIGDNPNYFALLCDSCHSSTNGGYENRKKSADGLKEIIDNKFGGKSYYTEEEMKEIGHVKISKRKWVEKN